LTGPHTFLVSWNRASSLLTVGIDGKNTVIDLTKVGPVMTKALPSLAPARSPAISITSETILGPGAPSPGSRMASDVRVNNVFVARE
jgi:hypothetical protein